MRDDGHVARARSGTYATSCSGAVDANYEITYVGGTTTVIPAPLTITASSGTMTYGGAVPVISPNVSGLQNGENVSVLGAGLACTTTATPTSSVGSYSSSCSGAVDANYTDQLRDGTVTVTPAPLVDHRRRPTRMTYGDPAPVITPIISGLQNGETATVLGAEPGVHHGARTPPSPVGDYASACWGRRRRQLHHHVPPGHVTVNPATLMVTASSPRWPTGRPPPAITASYSGFVNGDTAASLTTPPTCSTTATASSPVGSLPELVLGRVGPQLRHQLPADGTRPGGHGRGDRHGVLDAR